jgi:hypothetical protein
MFSYKLILNANMGNVGLASPENANIGNCYSLTHLLTTEHAFPCRGSQPESTRAIRLRKISICIPMKIYNYKVYIYVYLFA